MSLTSVSPVSVVIPTYNSSRFIQATLESVFAQRLPPREIIVVDDASLDDTAEKVESTARSAPIPIRLIHESENYGSPSRPLNVGITLAQGRFISTLDHDDKMLPCKIQREVECLSRYDNLGLVFGRIAQDQHENGPLGKRLKSKIRLKYLVLEKPTYQLPSREAYNGLVHGNYTFTCSNITFPKKVWQECGGFDENLTSACDYGFIQRVARHYDLGFIDEALIHWHHCGDSLYKQSRQLVRCLDLIRIYSQFTTSELRPETRRLLAKLLCDEYLSAGYYLREEGNYGGSLKHYICSIQRGKWNWQAIFGLAKLIPHRVMRSGQRA